MVSGIYLSAIISCRTSSLILSRANLLTNQKNLEDKANGDDEIKSNSGCPYLESDIIFNILARSSAPEVIQNLRSVCKEWNKLTSSSYFIDNHLRHNPGGIIAIPTGRPKALSFDFLQSKNKKIVVRRHCHLQKPFKGIIVGTCNGLVLLEDAPNMGDLSVSNPVTGQLLTLPPRARMNSSTYRTTCGITFVESSGEYKVVYFLITREDREDVLLGCEMLVVGTSKWKWISSPFARNHHINDIFLHHSSISIKGVFHMLFITGTLVSFDSTNENFHKSMLIPRPFYTLGVLQEINDCPSYAMLLRPHNGENCHQLVVWVLKDLQKGNWDKLYTVNLTVFRDKFPQKWVIPYVVAVFADGRFVILESFRESEHVYHVYDVQLHKLTLLKLDIPGAHQFLPHIESLVYWYMQYGLVLLKDMPNVGDLSVSNPIIGQLLTLPSCAQTSKDHTRRSGITFVESTGKYKGISVITDKGTLLGCEMLALGTSSTWKWISSLFQCKTSSYLNNVIVPFPSKEFFTLYVPRS